MISALESLSLHLVDLSKGITFGIFYSRDHLFNSYFIIPIGILVLFTILYGLNILLTNIIHFRFPSSVLGMLINLIVLCLLSGFSSLSDVKTENKTAKSIGGWSNKILTHYLILIKPSMNFTLKWINVFFIPSFIILPLSNPITFIECLKIAGVFVVGFVSLFLLDIYLLLGLQKILRNFGLLVIEEDVHAHKDEPESEVNRSESPKSDSSVQGFATMRDDITTIDISSIRPVKTQNESIKLTRINVENPFETVDITFQNDEHLLGEIQEPPPSHLRSNGPEIHRPQSMLSTADSDSNENTELKPSNSRVPEFSDIDMSERAKKVTIFITRYIDWLIYTLLFIVSLPLYYVSSIHTFLPYHLSITVLAYYAALLIPQKWPVTKRFAHPILISTAEILFVCFIGSLIYHKGKPKGFLDDLKYYKTGKNYINLFNNKDMSNNSKSFSKIKSDYTATPKWPGCGDILSSLMDISIVALSLPMFSYRRDFVKNFWVLMPPILISMCLTFFAYPIICHKLGIQAQRSIGFIGRSVTLALGTPLINSLEGSVSLMAVCTILSGICGVLVGDYVFLLLNISPGDYVTRGVSLGINCGAIATAHLLNVDPRAASMSSLSFSIFGTLMIILASIGAVRELITSWVGLT